MTGQTILTNVCAQIGSDDPAALTKVLEFVGDRHEGRADDRDLKVD